MSRGKNRKIHPTNRGINKRPPKQKFVLISEGKNTEPEYFAAVKRHYSGALIDFIFLKGAGVPKKITETAMSESLKRGLSKGSRKKKDSYELNDQVWAVFDRDTHPEFNQPIQKCKGNGIGVAYSNPCFELWLILHFENFEKPDDHHAVQKHLETLCSDYDRKKSKTTDCGVLMDKLEDAEQRAEKQLKNRKKEGAPFGPPSTTVFELTRAIRDAAEISWKR